MKYIDKLNIDEYDLYAKNHKLNNIFQCSSWAKTKSNWDNLYVGVKENEKLICACMILIRKLPFGFNFAYIPRGPLIDFENKELLSFFFFNLKKQLRSKRVVLTKFDPNYIINEVSFDKKDEIKNYRSDELVNLLKKFNIKHCGYGLMFKDSIQPRIQLEIPTYDFENTIPTKTMKKIKSSFNKGITVVNEYHNVDNLVEMINHTEGRHSINLRNKTYFENLLCCFKEDSCILTAYKDDKVVSSCLLVKCKKTCEILYSGYDDEYKKYNSTYALRFSAIEYAKNQNCEYFSFGGVSGTLDDGLTVFKSSFNPLIKIYVGEFDLLTYPILSFILSKLFPILKSKIRF